MFARGLSGLGVVPAFGLILVIPVSGMIAQCLRLGLSWKDFATFFLFQRRKQDADNVVGHGWCKRVGPIRNCQRDVGFVFFSSLLRLLPVI